MNKKTDIARIQLYTKQYIKKCTDLIIDAMDEYSALRVDISDVEDGPGATIGTDGWDGPMEIEYVLVNNGKLLISTTENSWTDFTKLLINWTKLYNAVCDALEKGNYERRR